MNAVDLFAGPGGWDVAAQQLGLDPIGIEWDDGACATREAAGLRTRQADVSQLHPREFAPVGLLIASPPCQDFSMAGKRAGIAGDRGKLVHEVIRWADALRPEFIACEQVPPVLDIWRDFAYVFRTWGYSAWCGILNAANYGVPQTRQRAILLACKSGQVRVPEPTHCRGGAEPSIFSDGLLPWVSMAEALGWGMDGRPSVTLTAGSNRQGGSDPLDGGSGARATLRRERDSGRWVQRERSGDRSEEGFDPDDVPSQTLTSKARSWTLHTNRGQEPDGTRQTVSTDNPAPSLTGKSGGQWQLRNNTNANASTRPLEEPAGTVFFGQRMNDVSWVKDEESVRITVEEAAALQSFPPGYPWQGSRTAQFTQIGNAIPPRLALHILSAVTGIALSERAA